VTQCPYKGSTSGYWAARTGKAEHRDIAWCHDFPTRGLEPIAGMIAFYQEKLDVFVANELLGRPKSGRGVHRSRS